MDDAASAFDCLQTCYTTGPSAPLVSQVWKLARDDTLCSGLTVKDWAALLSECKRLQSAEWPTPPAVAVHAQV